MAESVTARNGGGSRAPTLPRAKASAGSHFAMRLGIFEDGLKRECAFSAQPAQLEAAQRKSGGLTAGILRQDVQNCPIGYKFVNDCAALVVSAQGLSRAQGGQRNVCALGANDGNVLGKEPEKTAADGQGADGHQRLGILCLLECDLLRHTARMREVFRFEAAHLDPGGGGLLQALS